MAELRTEYKRKDSFFRRWAAAIILLLFFFGSWGGQFATELQVTKQLAEQHGQQFNMTEFWPEFWQSTLENWQSEWLQLFTQAVLISGFSSYLFRKQNEEHYKTQLMIEDLKRGLNKK